MKKSIHLMITICILISLCACGRDVSPTQSPGSSGESTEERWKLKQETLPLPEEIFSSEAQCLVGDRVHLFGNSEGPQLGYTYLDGETGIMELPENCEYIYAMCPSKGNLAVLAGTYPNTYIDADGKIVFLEDIEGRYEILLYNSEGKFLSAMPLANDYRETEFQFFDILYFEGEYLLISNRYIVRIGSDGSELGRSEELDGELSEGLFYEKLFYLDGQIIALRARILGAGSQVCIIDAEFLAPQKSWSFDELELRGLGEASDGRLLVNDVSDNTGAVIALDLDSGETQALFSWGEKADIYTQSYQSIIELEDGYLALGCNQYDIHKYRRVTGMEARTELTLALVGNQALLGFVTLFNNQNEDYHITAVDYEMDEDRAKLELSTGKGADIYYFESIFTWDEVNDSALFEDLLPFLDADEEYSRETFVPGLMEALSATGTMYRMPLTYMIDTWVGPGSLIPEPGISMDELEAVAAENSYLQIFPAWMTSEELLAKASSFCIGSYVDWESGTCNFLSDYFIATLEACKNSVHDYYEGAYEISLIKYMPLMNISNLGDFTRLYGEDYAFVGFPNDAQSNGSLFWLEKLFAISVQSKHKEGAWQFLRFLLSEEVQLKIGTFPVNNNALEVAIDRALNKSTITESEAEKFRVLVSGTNALSYAYPTIMDIIQQEARVYFAGQCTAQQAAERIQSRAQLYVSEQK